MELLKCNYFVQALNKQQMILYLGLRISTCCCIFPGWVEGIRLSDGERGWFPKSYVEEITSRSARLRNLRENIRIKCVTQKLED